MVGSSWQDLASNGGLAMAAGILKGILYKIFAAGAGSLKMNLVLFLVISVFVQSVVWVNKPDSTNCISF